MECQTIESKQQILAVFFFLLEDYLGFSFSDGQGPNITNHTLHSQCNVTNKGNFSTTTKPVMVNGIIPTPLIESNSNASFLLLLSWD